MEQQAEGQTKLICPIFKAVLILGAVDGEGCGLDDAIRWLELPKGQSLVSCDGSECAMFNVITGTCGLNNYTVTPSDL